MIYMFSLVLHSYFSVFDVDVRNFLSFNLTEVSIEQERPFVIKLTFCSNGRHIFHPEMMKLSQLVTYLS